MHYCDFLVEAVLIGKAGNDKCVYFSSSKVLPFRSPLKSFNYNILVIHLLGSGVCRSLNHKKILDWDITIDS